MRLPKILVLTIDAFVSAQEVSAASKAPIVVLVTGSSVDLAPLKANPKVSISTRILG